MISNLVFSLVAMTSGAQASEFFYQPPNEVAVLTAQAGYRRSLFLNDDKNTQNETISGAYRNGLKFDHGFSDKLSASVELVYTDLDRKSDGMSSMSGLEPLVLKFKGHEPVTSWSWLYEVDLTVGLAGAKSTQIGSVNRTLGDLVDGLNQTATLTPKVGIANSIGRSHHGLMASYDVVKLDTSFDFTNPNGESGSGKLTKANRSSLTGFYELHYDGFVIGTDVSWIKQWEAVSKYGTGNVTTPGYALLNAELYANIATSKNGMILPTITWNTTALWDTKENIDDVRGMIAFRQAL